MSLILSQSLSLSLILIGVRLGAGVRVPARVGAGVGVCLSHSQILLFPPLCMPFPYLDSCKRREALLPAQPPSLSLLDLPHPLSQEQVGSGGARGPSS